MRVVYSDKFLKEVKGLPKKIQIKLDSLIALLAQDPVSSTASLQTFRRQFNRLLFFPHYQRLADYFYI